MSVSPMNLYVRLSIGPVRQDDVDALLHAMASPRAKGESGQARAEVLQRIVDDPAIGALRGRDGRRVDEAAALALRSMDKADDTALSEQTLEPRAAGGAGTVPPTRPSIDPRSSPDAPSGLLVAGVLSVLWGLYEVFIALSYLSEHKSDGGLFLLSLLDTSLTMLLPGLLLLQSDKSSSRVVLGLVFSLVMMAIPAGALLSLLCVMVGGGGRVASTGDLAMAFLLGCVARFFLLMPLRSAMGASKRQKQGTPGDATAFMRRPGSTRSRDSR